MSIFWLDFEDFIRLAGSFSGKIASTEGHTNEVIHPLTYYISGDNILYIYRAFGNVIYGTMVQMTLIEQEMGFDAFAKEHLPKAIHLTQNY